MGAYMPSKLIPLSTLLSSLLFSSQLFANETCELPPDIDEEMSLAIKFEGYDKWDFKIVDVEDCWVRVKPRGSDKNYWYPIDGIQYIEAGK
jgi:hypothetical protein